MSIFKTKSWWSNETLLENNESEGLQNASCLKVDKFNSHNDSDCVIVCEGQNFKIYKPGISEQNTTHVVLEKQLDSLVLQVDTGKFIMNSEDQQILVLHPESYSIYSLDKKEGLVEAGEQNIFLLIVNHKFTKRAHSLTSGHFGNMKSRELVCIQSLDGTLSFFDQDLFLFMYIFTDVVVPGPISYISNSDCFVICKSTWILEIYSFQQLRDFSETVVRQNKKNIPQWNYNAGEEISSIQVIQTSSNFSSIIALGERYMYCFQDNGLMKFIKKFDFMPMCFHAYLIGWYYEPGARLLVMVASDDSKLFIYENTTLLWSCDLVHAPVAMARCFMKGLPGGIVTLSGCGVVTVSYIGTQPDLSGFSQTTINEPSNPEMVQAELEVAEEALQKIVENQDADNVVVIEELVKINIDVRKPVQNLFNQSGFFEDAALHLLMSSVIVTLTFQDPSLVQRLQISYVCYPPFTSSDSTICLDSVNGTEIIETNVFMSSEMDIISTCMEILFTVTNDVGRIIVTSKAVSLPVNLFCTPVEDTNEYSAIILIKTNKTCLDLMDLYSEFHKDTLSQCASTSTNISLEYRASKKIVSISTTEQEYSIKSNDFADILPVLESLVQKLQNYYTNNESGFEFTTIINKDLTTQLTHRFLKCIDSHAKTRIKLRSLEDQLTILQRQFTLVQKKLLVQYGSLPPGDCVPLEYLMTDTHERLQDTTNHIIQSREIVYRAGNRLVAVGNLVIYILRLITPDKFKVKLIEEMLTLHSLHEDYQDWEEAVSQAISYILKNVFTKSEKDKEKLAPVTEQGILSQINLKRFLKQIRLILDRMFAEALQVTGQNDITVNTTEVPKVVRIEEFIEVI